MNEILLFVEIIIVFSLLLLTKKLFKKEGLFLWIGIATILANVQVSKTVDIFGMTTTLGNVLFASNFLATDILVECYGLKESKKGVYMGLFSVIIYLIVTQITLFFTPSSIDITNDAMNALFGLAPRICISSVIMYFLSNLADVYLYNKLKEKFDGRKMWIRNNISTIVCNCLENFAFIFLAFSGIYTIRDMISIALVGSLIECIIAICDTPFLYMAKKIKD